MENVLAIILMSGLTGITAPTAGAGLSLFIGVGHKRLISFIMEFSAGLMIGIAAYDLLPEALFSGGYAVALAGLALGVVIALSLKGVVERHGERRTLLSTGVITILGVSTHNFFEGLAVGSGFMASSGLGLSLLFVIVLHDLPEGIGLGAPLRGAGMKPAKILLMAASTGLSMLAGTAVGACVGALSGEMIGFCLAMAAGTMMYLSFSDLIPSSRELVTSSGQGEIDILGVVTGLLFSKICF